MQYFAALSHKSSICEQLFHKADMVLDDMVEGMDDHIQKYVDGNTEEHKNEVLTYEVPRDWRFDGRSTWRDVFDHTTTGTSRPLTSKSSGLVPA